MSGEDIDAVALSAEEQLQNQRRGCVVLPNGYTIRAVRPVSREGREEVEALVLRSDDGNERLLRVDMTLRS